MIRLPVAYEPQLKAIAHQLEAGDRLIPASELEATTQKILQDMRPQERRLYARAYRRLLSAIEP